MGRSKIIPPKKRYYMILMFITAVVFCGFLSFQNGNGLRSDRFYIYEALCIFMCLLIVLLFEFARNKKDPFDNVFRNYKHIYILYLMGWVVCIADYYLPRTLTPLILIPIVISLTLDVYFGFTLSTILLLSYGLICEAQGTRIICYIFIILIGTVLSSSLKSKEKTMARKSYAIDPVCFVQMLSCCPFFNIWNFHPIPSQRSCASLKMRSLRLFY